MTAAFNSATFTPAAFDVAQARADLAGTLGLAALAADAVVRDIVVDPERLLRLEGENRTRIPAIA